MNTLLLMQTFCKVAEYRSFHAAANALGISPAAVSKQITSLEDTLGVTLFERTTRKVALTVIGEAYYGEAQAVLLALEQSNNLIAGYKSQPEGLLRVMSSRYFAEHIILPRMPSFSQQYPNVRLDLQIAEEVPHLLQEGLDVVFGMSTAVASNAVQKKITTTRYVLCASPHYLQQYGHPKRIEDLKPHRFITHKMRTPNGSWTFPGGETVVFEPAVYVNDAATMAALAVSGMGLAFLHHYQVAQQLAEGQLLEVLPEQRLPIIAVFLYYHPGRFLQPKIKSWVEAMTRDVPAFL
ncbi:LysR family transcriptional regulator [Legionella sp. MW5194]|uniref:LysR family transcriptional regulator n=1 Tax=Legionella sp. MW5194 TaxID=2662448 RepID=UPI00193D7CDA|nr:LysR family transcriptional regulator [Legionella sp. MW5194]QRN04402.1 LysR family transcriptional regulator [Legionella sp. MW5194]